MAVAFLLFIGMIVVLTILMLWLVGMFNGLVQLRNQMRNAWSQIDVQLKRRHDLIPNLVETVKGYTGHERDTLEAVVKARQVAMGINPDQLNERIQAENNLTQSLRSLFAVSEAYPDLKANQNYLALQEELSSTENKIGFARQHYNDTVMSYNNRTEMFPSSVIAGMFNFQSGAFFEIDDAGEREVPKVAF